MATLTDKSNEPAFYPPRIAAPDKPMPVWRFLPQFLINPLRTLPAAVYEEPLFAPPSLGGRMAWVTDPTLVERILLEDHEAFPKSPIEKRIFQKILGEGILTAEGQSWRWQRRTTAPIFRHSELTAFVPAMAKAAARRVESWRRSPTGSTRRIDTEMTDTTFEVLDDTIFIGATEAEGRALKDHIGAYLGHTSWDVAFEILQVPEWVWHPSKPAMRRHAKILSQTMHTVLDRERAKGFPGGGLMAKLGQARDPETGQPMADGLVANNLLTFAAAGHETTAKALTWTLYLLARSPSWQARVAEEVSQTVGNGLLTAAHLDHLPLTRQVLKEGMRLYPPAPVLGRQASTGVDLGGHHFEKGTMLVIPVWAIHRHRRLWEDPDRFDPGRFSPENEATIKRTQFMPFGFGPRTCIGTSFAMMESMALLATFVRDAHFSWDGRLAPEPVSRVTLRPRGGMTLTVTPR